MRQKRLRRTSFVLAPSAAAIGDSLRPASCTQKPCADDSVKMLIIACLRPQTHQSHPKEWNPYRRIVLPRFMVRHLRCAGCAGKEGRSGRLVRQSRAAEVAARFLVASEERTSLVSLSYNVAAFTALNHKLRMMEAAHYNMQQCARFPPCNHLPDIVGSMDLC